MLRRLTFAWKYLSRPSWDSGIPAPELVRAVAGRAPGRALDLGCGTGTNLRYLVEQGWQVAGVDFVPHAIAQARRKLRGYEVQAALFVGDVTRLEALALPGPFDLVLDMGCFHSLDDAGRRRYVAGLQRWLAPDGQYLLYAFQPDPDRGLWGLTREQVIAAFTPGLTLTGYEPGRGRPSAWYYFRPCTSSSSS